MHKAAFIAFSCFMLAAPAIAADLPIKAVKAPEPLNLWQVEVGARYWYSIGRTAYDLHTTGSRYSPVVSRLDYHNMSTHSGEVFFRLDSPMKFFVKGYGGFGGITGGTMNDEDFPPFFNGPYTKTESQTRGFLGYANLDVGYSFYESRPVNAEPRLRLGGFVGYHYRGELADAWGCRQTVPGGQICEGAGVLAGNVKVITERDILHSVRAGAVADLWFTPALKLTVDAAYTYSDVRAFDTHYFTFGTEPSRGYGHGFQLETVMSYAVTPNASVGIGARYWHTGINDFTEPASGAAGQAQTYQVDRYGTFIQSSFKF